MNFLRGTFCVIKWYVTTSNKTTITFKKKNWNLSYVMLWLFMKKTDCRAAQTLFTWISM